MFRGTPKNASLKSLFCRRFAVPIRSGQGVRILTDRQFHRGSAWRQRGFECFSIKAKQDDSSRNPPMDADQRRYEMKAS